MASFKVLLEFLGDSSKLEAAAGRVGSAINRIAQNVNAANAKAGTLSAGLQRALSGQGSRTSQEVNNLKTQLDLAQRNVGLLESKLQGLRSAKVDTAQVTRLEKSLANAEKKAQLLRSALAKTTPNTKAADMLKIRIINAQEAAEKLRVKLEQAKVPPNNTEQILKLEQRLLGARAKADQLSVALQNVGRSSGLMSGLTQFGRNLTTTFTSGLPKVITGFGTFVDKIRGGLMNINDTFRYTSQAITNIGRSLFFFISIPLIAFFSSMTRAAIDFEDAMVRVSKTTGLTGHALQGLNENLRMLAKNTGTSHVELAGIAEVIGQMGVTSVNAITNLTHIFEMATVTSNMSANDIAEDLGRIANAFGWNLNSSSEEVFRLMNVINMLENTTAASTSEIIKSMAKWAQAARIVGIVSDENAKGAASVAALSASLVSMGVTEEEAGTALKNMTFYMIKNADAVAQVMAQNEKYATSEAVINEINKDAVQVFLDIASAAEASDDNARKFLALMEIGSMRGGRALAALASNVELVKKNLEAAGIEWDTATSLAVEYERALQSTKMQLGMLRNNINDVGITIGDALLPAINQVIQVLVPALQMASEWFRGLSKQTQMWVIAIAAAVVIAGPLLMFLGQIFHAVTLMVLGFGQFLRIIPLVATGLAYLIPVIGSVVTAFLSWPGLIIGAIVLVLKVLSKMGVDIAGLFRKMGAAAKTWGENLAKNLANGLLAGAVRFVAAAIRAIANMIASFFESHSPPKDGPLKTIDKWGSKLIQTFLEGFKNADFSVLKEIGQIIETILTRGADEKELPAALKKYAKARVLLAQLIAKYNKTGLVDEGLLKRVTKGLGHMADEVRELIRLSLEYNRLQEKLADIERRRKDVSKGYNEEIAAIARSNMSIEEKVAAIRAAQRARDDSLRGLDKEEEAAQAQADAVKEQLEYQRQMIDAMNEQDDILQRIVDAINALKESLKGMSGADMGGFQFDMPSGDDLKKPIEEAMEPLMEFINRFKEGRTELQGFIDGWNGLKPKTLEELGLPSSGKLTEDEQKLYDTYTALYNLGQQADTVRDQLSSMWETATGVFADISGFFESLKGGGDGLDFSGITDFIDKIANSPALQDFVYNFILPIKLALPLIVDQAKKFGEEFSGLISAISDFVSQPTTQQFFSKLGEALGVVGLGVARLAGFFLGLLVAIGIVVAAAIVMFARIPIFFATLGANIASKLAEIRTKLADWSAGIINGLIDAVSKWWSDLRPKVEEFITNLIDGVKNLLGISSPSTIFLDIGMNLVQGLIDGIGSLLGALGEMVGKIGETIIGGIKALFGGGSEKDGVAVDSLFPTEADVQARANAIQGIIQTFQTTVLGMWDTFINQLLVSWMAVWQAIYAGLVDYTGQVVDVLLSVTLKLMAQALVAKGSVDNLRSSIISTTGAVQGLYEELKKMDGMVVKVTIKIDKQGSTSVGGGGKPNKTDDEDFGLASGGIAEAGSLHLVGERGPEGFVAPQRGMVIPTASLRRFFANGGGASAPMIQVIFQNPVVREEQDLKRLADLVSRVLSGRTYTSIKYGGAPTY